jgi:hypothetical protein
VMPGCGAQEVNSMLEIARNLIIFGMGPLNFS